MLENYLGTIAGHHKGVPKELNIIYIHVNMVINIRNRINEYLCVSTQDTTGIPRMCYRGEKRKKCVHLRALCLCRVAAEPCGDQIATDRPVRCTASCVYTWANWSDIHMRTRVLRTACYRVQRERNYPPRDLHKGLSTSVRNLLQLLCMK